jgi:hypothetical protein
MYRDYSQVLSFNKQKQVKVPNSNGWEHLMLEIPCADSHDHTPYEFLIHLHEVFPSRLRSALKNGVHCEINLAILPPRIAVSHTLELDHLRAKKVERPPPVPKSSKKRTRQKASGGTKTQVKRRATTRPAQENDTIDHAEDGVCDVEKQGLYDMAEVSHALLTKWLLTNLRYSQEDAQRFFESMAHRNCVTLDNIAKHENVNVAMRKLSANILRTFKPPVCIEKSHNK